jgi:hypothetical protein
MCVCGERKEGGRQREKEREREKSRAEEKGKERISVVSRLQPRMVATQPL